MNYDEIERLLARKPFTRLVTDYVPEEATEFEEGWRLHDFPNDEPIALFLAEGWTEDQAKLVVALVNAAPKLLRIAREHERLQVDATHSCHDGCERVAATLRDFICGSTEEEQRLPALRFIMNRDDQMAAAALAALRQPVGGGEVVLNAYDAGLLGDGGGGNVEWWQDYLRAELGRAHEFYQDQVAALAALRLPDGGGNHIADAGKMVELVEAAHGLLNRMSSTYRARNGRQMGVQADDGEKCWIVHSDDIEALRAALTEGVKA